MFSRFRWGSPASTKSVLFIAVQLVLASCVTFLAQGSASALPRVGAYQLPVTAPITDYFRQPVTKYSAGNRGVEFSTPVGSDVVASNAGTVVFAGKVAGTTYLVIVHDDGLRTTYGNLSSMSATQGEKVSAGQRIGSSAPSFFFGVRDGENYLDPLSLIGNRVQLVDLKAASVVAVQASPAQQAIKQQAIKQQAVWQQAVKRAGSGVLVAGLAVGGLIGLGLARQPVRSVNRLG